MNCYEKILRISNAYYNDGLAKANVRDLSGAINSLTNSLRYNKANTQARNLLGLVYFEMGESVLALREWVISANIQPEDNLATEYLKKIQAEKNVLNTANQTIKKYNQALNYCKNGDIDLAVIQLKKVLSLNPKLVKAYQLLALVYIHQEHYSQAKDLLRKAGRIDANNTTTLRYLKEVNAQLYGKKKKKEKKTELAEDSVAYRSGNEVIITPSVFKDNTMISTVLNIFFGVVVGFLISYFLIVPSSKQQIRSETAAELVEANDTIATKNVTIKNLEKQIADLTGELEDAKTSNTNTEEEILCYKQVMKACQAYNEGDIEQAGKLLAETKKAQVSSDMKKTYTAISEMINEKYLEQLYRTGGSYYNQWNYEAAIEYYSAIVEIDETYGDGNTMYYLAQCYRKIGKNQKAKELYQKVIAQYPDTDKAASAQRYLNEMAD